MEGQVSRIKLSCLLSMTIMVVACTQTGTVTRDPTGTTDLFAPTPTIGASTTTEAPQSLEKALLLKVDPLLNPDPAREGIPMGDWWYGHASPTNRWLLAQVGYEEGSAETRLVDLVNWEISGKWHLDWTQGQAVTDDGIGYVIEGVAYVPGGTTASPRMVRVRPGGEDPEGVAELPQGFNTWDQMHIDNQGRVLAMGYTLLDPELGAGPADLLVVEPAIGDVRDIPLPGVRMGTVDEVDIGQDWLGYVNVIPTVVWDGERSRALVVNGDRLVVTEVDLKTGQVLDHPYSAHGWSAEPPSGGATASAVLSPDGARLYVARSESWYQTGEDTWTRTTTSKGIVVIDTSSWEVIHQLEEPMATVALSPGGQHLLAWGFQQIEGNEGSSMQSEPTLLIDPMTLDVRFRLGPPNEGSFSSFGSFDAASQLAYVTWWDNISHLEIVDLETGAVLGTREGDQFQVLSESGLMGVYP